MDLNAEIDYRYAKFKSFMYINASPGEIMEIGKGNENLRGGEHHIEKCHHFRKLHNRKNNLRLNLR